MNDYDTLVSSALGDGGLSGVIKLGVLRTTLTGLTPRAMAVLKAKFPEMGLHIKLGLTATLLADLERGTLDAAIVTKPTLMPVGVVFRDLTQESMRLIIAVRLSGFVANACKTLTMR